MVPDAGHYPHVDSRATVSPAVLAFTEAVCLVQG